MDTPFKAGLLSILLLEQGTGSLNTLRKLLSEASVCSLSAAEKHRAADLVSHRNVDIAFCDLDKTDADHSGFLCQLQRVHPGLAIVRVVADEDVAGLLSAFRSGVADVLVQPVTTSELDQVLSRIEARAKSQATSTQLLNSSQRALDQLVLLKSISDTTREVGDLESLLDHVTALIGEALKVEIVSLMLTDEEGKLQIQAATGLPTEVVDSVRVSTEEGIAGQVFASGEAVLMDNLNTDGRFPPKEYTGRYRTGSLLSVPLACHGRVFGVLNVNNKVDGDTFVGSDLELLKTIAHLTSLAIENFKLVDRLRRQTVDLEHMHDDLLAFHEERNRFVCSLSHELKTPLTSILGFADLMLESYDQIEVEKLREYIGAIHGEAIHLNTLLSGMLRLFSIDSGTENWHWEELDLTACTEEACQKFVVPMAEMDVSLDLLLPEDLLPVWGDRAKIALLLDALLDNAVKYNCCGGTIRINALNSNENGLPHVYLSIANQGQSFPAEYADDLSLRSLEGNNRPEHSAGLVGIGLATCRAILHQMRGRVFLEESSEDGTTFGILLPTRMAYEDKSNE